MTPFNRLINWRYTLIGIAILIVAASLFYTSNLTANLAKEERKKVKLFAEGIKTIANAKNNEEISLATNVITQDSTIPRIITDIDGNIQDLKAIDTNGVKNVNQFLQNKIQEFKSTNAPIRVNFTYGTVIIYYGESKLLSRLQFFPYAQLAIISVFLIIVILSLSTAHKSIQNQVWIGLSKETAHQLGTPISSIEGWIELLKLEYPENTHILEMQNDIERLKLVADRFGKIGSNPPLIKEDIVVRLNDMVNYMQKRAPGKVKISFETDANPLIGLICGPIFDWVIENLIRNALDAMEGKGQIHIHLSNKGQQILIDISDTGKGIPKHIQQKVFTPGFSTKKRGWGLGLTLSKRIIENYHKGQLFIKYSEAQKGTCFRIMLPK